jgi:hypothetical protein
MADVNVLETETENLLIMRVKKVVNFSKPKNHSLQSGFFVLFKEI